MPKLGWVVLVLALLQGGWMTFDGSRALIVGDYVTPSSGPKAGQLGPWAGVVSSVGIAPRSTLMKSTHVVLGLAWLVSALSLVLRLSWAWGALLGCAVLSLWYAPVGTVVSLVQIVLLTLPSLREPFP